MRTVNHDRNSFAKTNIDSIHHRISILRQLLPKVNTMAEICCGDCKRQYELYRKELGDISYRGLDIDPQMIKKNKANQIDCICGNALDAQVMKNFLHADVIFFGPPLSDHCDGHTLLQFNEVNPSFLDFLRLMYVDLKYDGLINCICPRSTSLGDITWLYNEITGLDKEVKVPLIHYSHSNRTGNDEIHETRLKYIEVWFSKKHENNWEILKLGETDSPSLDTQVK
jgi:hypothetical protein